MAEGSLALARRQNDSLEKSLRSLRGKLVGLRSDALSRKPNQPLRTIGKENLGAGERIDRAKTDTLRSNRENESYKATRPVVRKGNISGKPKTTTSQNIRRPRDRVSFIEQSKVEGNFFDEFRNKVNEIRTLRQEAPSHDRTVTSGRENLAQNDETTPRISESCKPGEARQFLITKIERQNQCIEDLEAKVEALEFHNEALYQDQDNVRAKLRAAENDARRQEMLHRHALSHVRSKIDDKAPHAASDIARYTSVDRDEALSERQKRVDLGVQLEETKRENNQLRHRVTEIAERAHLLNSIHEQRVKTLESKLKASIEVAQYYCHLLGKQWPAQTEDSTEEILFGSVDHTTIDLIKDLSGFQNSASGKKSLRSYFLAVLFTVRLKNEVEAQKLWEPYLQL